MDIYMNAHLDRYINFDQKLELNLRGQFCWRIWLHLYPPDLLTRLPGSCALDKLSALYLDLHRFSSAERVLYGQSSRAVQDKLCAPCSATDLRCCYPWIIFFGRSFTLSTKDRGFTIFNLVFWSHSKAGRGIILKHFKYCESCQSQVIWKVKIKCQ